MAATQFKKFDSSGLGEWTSVGAGGFGDVFKAKHKPMGHYVAIKLIKSTVSDDLLGALTHEASYLKLLSCKFVLSLYGMYEGVVPGRGGQQTGMVMDYLKRGSIKTLSKSLAGPPPFPLSCRMIHEVALGMNFLHSLGIMHRDLKPDNVMLTDELHVQLADFGLSTESVTYMQKMEGGENKNVETESAGTIKYMPPEAFDINYELSRSFDRYSYGILIWSILAGKEPYAAASDDRVKTAVSKGARPPRDKLPQQNEEGMKDLLDLMEKCWDQDPRKRPGSFEPIIDITEKVHTSHQNKIHYVVYKILNKLDSYTIEEHPTQDSYTIDEHLTQIPQPQMTVSEKAEFVVNNKNELLEKVKNVDRIVEELKNVIPKEAYEEIKAQDTIHNQMLELWDGPLDMGEEMKAAFYDALKKHEPQMVEKLGG